jgi:hypothetical protein
VGPKERGRTSKVAASGVWVAVQGGRTTLVESGVQPKNPNLSHSGPRLGTHLKEDGGLLGR